MVNAYYTVGVIAGTHGLRGEVKVLSRTDFPEKRFAKGSQLFIRKEGQTPFQKLEVSQRRQHKQYWLVQFEGFASINEVEAWKGMQLCIHESELELLPEGTYYIHQLIGLAVYTDEDIFVGELIDVLSPGANDVYVVRGPLQKKDVLIPAIPSCVLSVDLAAKKMKIHMLPGLLEEDEF